jgi:putative Holliday junction resolvase
MGLDLGDKTIGVAVSDPLGWTAQAVEVIRRRCFEDDLNRLRQLAAEYEVQEVVVGHPRNMDGSLGPRAEAAADFAGRLAAELNLPVRLWDERLTTVAAERILLEADLSRARRRRVIDKTAAALMLQNYLEAAARRNKNRT